MYLNNLAAGIDCFLVVRVENVEEEGNAASLQHVFHNFFTLFADLTDATEKQNFYWNKEKVDRKLELHCHTQIYYSKYLRLKCKM